MKKQKHCEITEATIDKAVANNDNLEHLKEKSSVCSQCSREIIDLYEQIPNPEIKQCIIELLRDFKQ